MDTVESKGIPQEAWARWCDTFTNGNRGRAVTIFAVESEMDVATLVEGAALVAIDYDTPGRGNDFVVSYGDTQQPNSHVIEHPVALRQDQDSNGRIHSLEIGEHGGRRTVVRFQN